jgi:hypothetical protein
MEPTRNNLKIGEWAFLVGIILAVALAVFPGPHDFTTPGLVLGVLGLIVGLVNISSNETQPFLVASITLLLAGSAGLEVFPSLGWAISNILLNISQFVAPAAMIVALKTVLDIARKA